MDRVRLRLNLVVSFLKIEACLFGAGEGTDLGGSDMGVSARQKLVRTTHSVTRCDGILVRNPAGSTFSDDSLSR